MKVFVEHKNKWVTVNCDETIKSVNNLAQAALKLLKPVCDENSSQVSNFILARKLL